MPESGSLAGPRPKLQRPFVVRRASGGDPSARLDRSNTLPLTSCNTWRQVPASAIPFCRDRPLYFRTFELWIVHLVPTGLFDSEWKVGSCGRRVEADRSPQLGI